MEQPGQQELGLKSPKRCCLAGAEVSETLRRLPLQLGPEFSGADMGVWEEQRCHEAGFGVLETANHNQLLLAKPASAWERSLAGEMLWENEAKLNREQIRQTSFCPLLRFPESL